MPSTDHPLAIVVPAFKAEFLAEALRSIAAQTDQRFQLYVFDDASPHDLAAIFHAAGLPASASFHRFEENVGGRSLVESWARSVAATREPWVWLFSDDDVMDPGCVAAFYQALDQDGDAFNVYRFNVLVINHEGEVIRIHPPSPQEESAKEFLYHRLTEQHMSTAPEHIFRRRAYETRGGFVDFPYGMGSDDATWINLVGQDTAFRGIPGPRVCWRLSRINLSSFSSNYVDKHRGLLTYAAWIYEKYQHEPLAAIDGRRTIFRIPQLVRRWFVTQVHRSRHFYSPGEISLLAEEAAAKIGFPKWQMWLVLLRSNAYFVYDRIKWAVAERLVRPGNPPS